MHVNRISIIIQNLTHKSATLNHCQNVDIMYYLNEICVALIVRSIVQDSEPSPHYGNSREAVAVHRRLSDRKVQDEFTRAEKTTSKRLSLLSNISFCRVDHSSLQKLKMSTKVLSDFDTR